jgi:uncharacterized membrane protein YphA (DoxX/SURF4 family)
MLDNLFAPYAGAGELILRLALGMTFFAHGRDKLKNPAGFAGFLRQLRVPQGGGWDLEFLLLAVSVALVLTGGGRFAIDSYLGL